MLDFSGTTAAQMQLLLQQVRTTIGQEKKGSVLVLADFEGAEVDHGVAMKIKEVLTLDRPFVKKSAWLHTDKIPHAFLENFHNFSQRDIVTFKSREEALDWLAKE